MPRRSRAESEATAARVLATAATVFASSGYAGVALEDVAAAAGVTRGAVYHHFGSKQRLFQAVVDHVMAQLGERVAAAADAVDDPWTGLVVGCRTFLSAACQDGVRQVLLVDAPAVLAWGTWREQDRRGPARHLHEALQELAGGGRLATGSVAATTALLSGAMNEAALWVADQLDRDRALTEAGDALERLLEPLRRTPDPTPAALAAGSSEEHNHVTEQ